MRAERAALVFATLLPACGTVAMLTRPDGDGGWSPARREAELGRRAAAAAVVLEPVAEPAAPAEAPPLTLAAALARAARENRRIAEARRQLDMAGARVQNARGRLLPAVTGSGRYSWYTDPLTTGVVVPGLPGGIMPPGFLMPDVVIREADFGVVNGTLTLPLDVWGELRHTLAAAQAGYRGERARLWATTLGEQGLVIRSYFDLLEAERLRAVTDQTLTLQRQQLDNAQARFTSGRVTKNELLVVQVAVRDTEQQLVQRTLAIDRARWTLNEAIGLPVDAPTTVAGVERPPDVPETPDALRLAYEHNPALLALVEEQQRLEDAATALARSRFPRPAAGASIDYSTSDIPEPQRVGAGFVGFTWDLGTDGRREADIAEARLAAERNRLAIEAELRRLEAAVRTAQRAVAERLAALAAAEAAVGQAEENLRIRQQQFDAGRAASEDVLDAEALLAAQRATLATALYQAHVRRADLQQLLGLPLEDLVADGG